MKRTTLVDRFMAERIVLGGVVMPRFEALRQMRAEGHCSKSIDYAVMGKREVSEQDVAAFPAIEDIGPESNYWTLVGCKPPRSAASVPS